MHDSSAAPRVVIVDDDVWVRTGRAAALAETGAVVVAAVLSHQQALGRGDLWAASDVVLVDAWDRRAGFDQFPGVGVVERIRQGSGPRPPRIVVVTGHVVNDLLRLRMAQAGADAFYGHDDVLDVASLLAALLAPQADPPLTVSGERLRALGVRPGTRPNAVLAWIRDHGYEEAFNGESQKSLPVSRRAVMTIRRNLDDLGKLAVAPPTGSSRPPRSATWQQVVRFVNRTRGAADPPDHRGDGPG